jgi:hypothetical protein
MIDQVVAKARVQLLVEVEAGQPWGGDCQIGQLYQQAAESARSTLINALKPGVNGITIIGEPKVVGIITESRRVIQPNGME